MNKKEIKEMIYEELENILTERVNPDIVDEYLDDRNPFNKFFTKNYRASREELSMAIYDFANKNDIDIDDETADYLANVIFVDLVTRY